MKTLSTCNKCGVSENLNVEQHAHRPVIQLDRITWITHKKIKFPGSNHHMNGIDPKFLSKSPAIVKERFPFSFSGSRHAVTDQSLIQIFLSL